MSAQKDGWVFSFLFLLFCASSIPTRGSERLLQELSPQEYFGSLQAGRASLAYFSHNGTCVTVCIYISLGFQQRLAGGLLRKWNNEKAIREIFKPKVILRSWLSSAGKSMFAQLQVLLAGRDLLGWDLSWLYPPSNLFINFLDCFLDIPWKRNPTC